MAARYWVGGTDTWNNAAGTKWALTDGGAGGQSVPSAGDEVFFTALSGAVTVTWASGASPTVFRIICTGFTGTLATGGFSKTLAGTGAVWSSPATCTITGSPTMTVSYSGGVTITVTCDHAAPSAANSIGFTFASSGGTATYTLNLNGAGFRSLTFLSPQALPNCNGTVSVYGNVTLFSANTYTLLSITFLAAATIIGAGRTIDNMTVNAPGATVTTSGALTVGASSILNLIAGTLSLGGTLSTAKFDSSNTNIRAINFGTNNIPLTSTAGPTTLLDMADATNFTYTGTGGFTRNNTSFTIVVFGTTGGSTTNAPNLTVNGGTQSFTITNGSWFNNLSFVGSSTFTSGSVNVNSLIISPTGIYSNFNPTFRRSATFTTLSVFSFGIITVNGAGITVSLSSTGTTAITGVALQQGTLSITSNLQAGSFTASTSNVRALTLAASITFTVTLSLAAWSIVDATNLTLTPNTSTISMTSASAKTFAGGGLTYYNLNQGGTGALTITGSNTFNNITNTVQPTTVTFTAGTTQTVSNFSLSGTAASKITINSSSAGTQFTLSKASGTVTAQNLRIQDSNATGGAGWYAFNSTNLGNSTGWNFQSPNMLAFLI